MKVNLLYKLEFYYTFAAEPATTKGEKGIEEQHFFMLEGKISGQINGKIKGCNHPVCRPDDVFMSDAQIIIETDDGASIFADLKGMGVQVEEKGYRSYVGPIRHLSSSSDYNYLNTLWCMGSGVVGATARTVESKKLTKVDVYTIEYEDGIDGL